MITIDRILAIRASDIADFMCQRPSLPPAALQLRSHSFACRFSNSSWAIAFLMRLLEGTQIFLQHS